MQDLILMLINLFVLVFVLTSMFGTGLSLTVSQILDPLKDWKLVLLAPAANFVVVPALAYVIALVLGLSEGLRTGLIILAACAGAPFLPKLATIAQGNLAFSVGLMVLLMVVTVGFAPIVLPLLISGVTVNPWDIARPLITLMLIPLAIGLFVKAWQPGTADSLAPYRPGHSLSGRRLLRPTRRRGQNCLKLVTQSSSHWLDPSFGALSWSVLSCWCGASWSFSPARRGVSARLVALSP